MARLCHTESSREPAMRWHVCVRGFSSQWVLPFTTCRPRPQIVACVLSSTFKRGLNGPRYSEDETKRFREMLAQNKSLGEIAEAFPERPYQSLTSKLRRLRRGTVSPSSKRSWSDDEDQRLTNLKLQGTPWSAIVQQFPERSMFALDARWRHLAPAQLRKETRIPRPNRYSEQDDAIIKKCVEQGMHWKQIASDHFPNRSPRAIKTEIETLRDGIERSLDFKWTAELEERLRKLYNEDKLSFSDIGKTLGCSAVVARRKNSVLTRGKPRRVQRWSGEASRKLLALLQAGRPFAEFVKAFPEKKNEAISKKAFQLRQRHGIPVYR